MSSRLVRDGYGRFVVEVTVPRRPDERAGTRFLVLGNDFESGGVGVGFLGTRTGRRPSPDERQQPRQNGRPASTRQTWPPEYPDRARELHAGGLSCPKVAAELGVPYATVKTWIWPGKHTETQGAGSLARGKHAGRAHSNA